MNYAQAQLALAAATAAAVEKAHQALRAAAFVVVASGVVAAANMRAVALADISLAQVVGGLPFGLGRPADDADRLARSFATIEAASAEIAPMRIERLAMAEPLNAGRLAYREGMIERGVPGWTRKAQPNACELCRSLADGTVLPAEHAMYQHPRCDCVAVPVLDAKAV